jgi:formate dehydrogenase subunit delta
MNIENLVTMANDISAFFDADLGAKDAPMGIATHITRYWDPRMRSQIRQHVAAGGAGLSASALAAVKSLPEPAPRSA